MTNHTDAAAGSEDRTLPAIVYALFLIGLTHGLTTIIGLIICYVARDTAGPRMRDHYTWLIRTFWITLLAGVAGCLLLAVGVPLSFILIGVPLVVAGGVILGAAWIYCAVRAIIGVVFLARDEPLPRPNAYLA